MEPIEWIVLATEKNRSLILSRYVLDRKPYNSVNSDATWEASTLRTWLNEDFLNTAFSEEELKRIPTVTVSAEKNPKYSADTGNSTQDQVFLLSIQEVNKYSHLLLAVRQSQATVYAMSQGGSFSDCRTWWWLRSPASTNYASYVRTDGYVSYYGTSVSVESVGVRPAMWVSLAF